MLIGTFCRFSVRFCAVTVTALSVATFFCVVGVASGAGVWAASCAKAVPVMARQIAAASGNRVNRVLGFLAGCPVLVLCMCSPLAMVTINGGYSWSNSGTSGYCSSTFPNADCRGASHGA
jgi:hypothetical protein